MSHTRSVPVSSLSVRTEDSARPVIAAVLSVLVPGLGQVFNRQLGKGLVVFFLSFLVIPYVYGIIDAYFVAKKQRERLFLVEAPAVPMLSGPLPEVKRPAATAKPAPSLEQQLLSAAQARGGELSVTEGVLATGHDFAEVEAKLAAMCRSGYVDVGNRANSGVVVYRFAQLG